MKSLSCVAIAVIACYPIFAQDPLGAGIAFVYIIPDGNAQRIDMTFTNKETLSGTAATVNREKSTHLMYLRGGVNLTIDGIRLRADEVTIAEDSGEITPSGNVRITKIK
jgi:lipopolysaccharide assembly outer membrane protein LptD (OstA)